jgi:hypothetical protein
MRFPAPGGQSRKLARSSSSPSVEVAERALQLSKARLGFDRIVVSGKEAPILLANFV